MANPAISVIIPMYNAEAYINECLESLLAQTFQDFEVVVVDDCSTDDSVKIVESYAPKFNGRLHITHTKTNSGGGGEPRNIGLKLAKGKYIFFVDADDFIMLNALEILYTKAEENETDIVYYSAYYRLPQPNNIYLYKDGKGKQLLRKNLEDAPDLIVNDPNKILRQFLTEEPEGNFRGPVFRFIRRDFLIENEIIFPNVSPGEDFIWVINVYCHAKRFLRISTPLYFYRCYNTQSVTQTKRKPANQVSRWISGFVSWAKFLSKLSRENDILRKNPAYCQEALKSHFRWSFQRIEEARESLSSQEIYELLINKLAKEDDLRDLTLPFFFSVIDANKRIQKENIITIDELKKSDAEYKQRISELTDEISRLELKKDFMASPAISVIIPMYNREKYIGECLDSLLAQTLKNFEVIIIDDCSTDNSISVVESYIPKFGGRLKLDRMEKNSGHPGEPRNRGIALSCGKYIYCLDSDDIITETALEEMYTLGKKFDADVVYCEKYFKSEGFGQRFRDHIRITDDRFQKPPFVDKPTLEIDNLEERVRKLLNGNYWMSPALKIVKRDLLMKNNITFPPLIGSEDDVWSSKILFCSKRFLRIPNICFIRRIHEEGISFGQYTTPDHVQRWMDATIRSLKAMDTFMQDIKFFREHPDYRYKILNRSVKSGFTNIFEKCKGESDFDIYSIFYNKFGKYLGDYDVLVSALCAHVVNQSKTSAYDDTSLNPKFKNYITARLDVKLRIEKGEVDFKIFSMSDGKAKIIKPTWFQYNGVGYMITSMAGKLEFVAKADKSGQLQLGLKGLDVRQPDDSSKRIPYWIDYTKLTVNGKTIFDTVKSAWHDKPYVHYINVKADEEITVQVEWLPHINNT